MKLGFQFNDTFPTRKEVMDKLYKILESNYKIEEIPVFDALGRVVADDILSVHNVPLVRASCLDGVAVKSDRFKDGMPDTSSWVNGVDFVRTDTGDDFPDEFDAVIRIECVDITKDGQLEILDELEIKPGTGTRGAGSTIKEGELLVKKGTQLRSVELSAIVMGGVTKVPVYKKPIVAFIPTGDELVAVGEPITRGKTVDSNSILIMNRLKEFGAEPLMYPIVKDNKKDLETTIKDAINKADMVLINGGSSLGSEDYNAVLIEEMGDVIAHGVLAAPGKPCCIGLVDGKPLINIPGPPNAVYYVSDWLVRGIVRYMTGLKKPVKHKVMALLTEDICTPFNVEIMCKMHTVKNKDGLYETRQIPFKGSSVSEVLCSNSCYITKPGTAGNKAGEYIDIELLVDEAYL